MQTVFWKDYERLLIGKDCVTMSHNICWMTDCVTSQKDVVCIGDLHVYLVGFLEPFSYTA